MAPSVLAGGPPALALLLLRASGLQEGGAGNGTAVSRYCGHGDYDWSTKKCKCHDGWDTSGITDTIDFLEGVCQQYRCQSDEVCQRILKIPYATCPISGWNCLCGWKEAVMSYGHGYETYEESGAECMGVLYTFSVQGTWAVEGIMLQLWKYFLIPAVLFLPLGRKRAICDHHRPTMWNSLRYYAGLLPVCQGDCVLSASYTMDCLKDDLAWTLFVLDVCAWTYVFLATAWLIVMFIWCMILWALVLLALVAMMIAWICAPCLCGDGGDRCDCCNCLEADAGGCDWCSCCMPWTYHSTTSTADTMYFLGPYPNDIWWLYSPSDFGGVGHCDCGCERGCCATLVRPIAWLVYVFPHVPENAWGGLLGRYVFGTHHLTPVQNSYQGGNCLIEFLRMGWQRPADLHDNMDWRRQVHDWLLQSLESTPQMAAGHMHMDGRSVSRVECEVGGVRRSVLRIGRARGIVLERPFDMERDCLIESSFEDYEENRCWICQSGNDQWDLWLSCRHVFCSNCSTQMLQRQMPCPLCRVFSATVLRGRASGEDDDESESSESSE